MRVRDLPLSWYINKLEQGEPFCSLLYGDGEFLVASRQRTGQKMAYGELVTREMEDEMIASLEVVDERVIRGTDPHLIDYMSYNGGDKNSFRAMARASEGAWKDKSINWVNGCVWEDAVRSGKAAPLFRVLSEREWLLVGNDKLDDVGLPGAYYRTYLPRADAYGFIATIEQECRYYLDTLGLKLCVVCMGLGAIPLILRLTRDFPEVTFLDLGSLLDIFTGAGSRGWQKDVWSDKERWAQLMKANLSEVPYDSTVDDPLGVAVPYLSREPKWLILGGLGDAPDAQQALLRWPGAKVIGIDPDPRAIDWQLDHGWPEGMPLILKALSDRAETARMRLDDLCCSSLHHHNLEGAIPSQLVDVETVTLDCLDEEYHFEDAILWLDCEGFDYKALKGAPKLLASNRALLVGIEIHYRLADTNQKMERLLLSLGYRKVHTWFKQWWGHNEIYTNQEG